MGIGLTVTLGVGVQFGSGIFTKDMNVQRIIHKGLPVCHFSGYNMHNNLDKMLIKCWLGTCLSVIPFSCILCDFFSSQSKMFILDFATQFVAGTQTINSLAFVFDGINFGASDYTYSAYSMASLFTLQSAGLLSAFSA